LALEDAGTRLSVGPVVDAGDYDQTDEGIRKQFKKIVGKPKLCHAAPPWQPRDATAQGEIGHQVAAAHVLPVRQA
jgi:hypothetical protein